MFRPRRMARFAVVLVTIGLGGSALAEPPAIQGSFGFDVFKPKQKCAKVTGALLAKLTKYVCKPAETESASGKPTLATCTAKRGQSEYMLFAKLADCTEERETQLANGGDG